MAKKPRGTSKKTKAPRVITPETLEVEYKVAGEERADEPADESSAANSAEDSDDVAELTGEIEPGEDEIRASLPAVVATGEPEAISPAQQNLLKRYLEEVSRYALLTPEEEYELALKLKQTGDLEAARRLVNANLRLVVKIAMEYRSTYQNVLDLIQEGNVGLMKAVSKFDPAKGAKLSYYASWWIRSYILKYLLDNFRLVKIGTTQAQKKLFFNLMREKERLEAQGLHSGPKLLADRLHVREKDVVEMEQRLSGRGAEMSLNAPVGDEDGESKTSHLDLLADSHPAPDDRLANTEVQEILKAHLDEFAKTLKEKELAVFKERLAAEEPKTLQEVADKFGLTRERARQIETQVIEKLREYYKTYIR